MFRESDEEGDDGQELFNEMRETKSGFNKKEYAPG